MADTDTSPTTASAPPLAANMRRLRGILAERQITHTHFGEACGLSRAYLCHILSGDQQPGELATIKLARGIAALGLDQEAQRAS